MKPERSHLPELVLLKAAELFPVAPQEILSPIRSNRIARARFAVMVTLYDLGFSLVDVGLICGRRDHSTVIHARRRLPVLASQDPDLADRLQTLRDAFALPPLLPAISSQTSVKSSISA